MNNESGSVITNPAGLGDTVYNIIHRAKLHKLADVYTEITGNACGCEKRREALNKLVPYENN